jgi:hypothetical protein
MSDDYPSNSHNRAGSSAPQQGRRQLAPVVSAVQVRRKPLSTRILDRGSTIWQDVVAEVIKPYILDLFAESFHAITDRTFYGDSTRGYRGPRPGKPGQQSVTPAGYVITDYSSQYSGGPAPSHHHGQSPRPFDFSIYSFANYADGREIIDRLTHVIHEYGTATVNDLYDLLNMAGTQDHTGENYGWEGLGALSGAEVRRVRGGGGFYLDIPDARPIRK